MTDVANGMVGEEKGGRRDVDVSRKWEKMGGEERRGEAR